MDVRRVVTGHDADGQAVFVSDDLVAPVAPTLTPGAEFHLLWGADTKTSFPDDGSKPPVELYFRPLTDSDLRFLRFRRIGMRAHRRALTSCGPRRIPFEIAGSR